MTQPQPVGIDLGTTHSAVGYFDAQGRTALLRNAAGELLTPSVVLFDDDEIVVGREALKAARNLPDRVAFGVKRDAGQTCYSRPIRGRLLPPEAIQAAILRQLRQEAVAALGESLSAVITVPAYFDEVRRRATRRAAELAGWQVHDIVNEPTAAALAWCEQTRYFDQPPAAAESQKLFVYDLGGGTLDVTVIELSAGAVRTLATDGDFRLGGVDWDERLVNHAAEQFLAAYGGENPQSDPRGDEASRMRLFAAAEQAKQTLSQRGSTTLHVEHDGRSLAVPVTRELFERLTEDLLERTAFTSRQTLAAAGCTWNDIDHILLVGGSSRMPMVARCLRELSGQEPTLSATCDEDVARGAALFARVRLQEAAPAAAGETRDANPDNPPAAAATGVWTPPALPAAAATAAGEQDGGHGVGGPPAIIDVNSHSLGIQGVDRETLQRENVILIPRNTPLPAAKSHLFTTRTVDQRTVVIQVLEGENRSPELCSQVARAVLRDLPPGLPAGTPIEVVYRYQRNGLLTVEAHLPGGGGLTIEVERDAGLSAAGYSQWREVLGSIAAADGWLRWTAAAAEQAPDMTPQLQPESEAALEATPDEPHAFQGVATAEQGASVGDAYREQQELRKQAGRRRLISNLVGHVVASGLGLILGYIILCWLSPRADFLHLFHD